MAYVIFSIGVALRVVRIHDDAPDALRQAPGPEVAALHLRHKGKVPRAEGSSISRQPHQEDQGDCRRRERVQR